MKNQRKANPGIKLPKKRRNPIEEIQILSDSDSSNNTKPKPVSPRPNSININSDRKPRIVLERVDEMNGTKASGGGTLPAPATRKRRLDPTESTNSTETERHPLSPRKKLPKPSSSIKEMNSNAIGRMDELHLHIVPLTKEGENEHLSISKIAPGVSNIQVMTSSVASQNNIPKTLNEKSKVPDAVNGNKVAESKNNIVPVKNRRRGRPPTLPSSNIQKKKSNALDGNPSQTLNENGAKNNTRFPKKRRRRAPATHRGSKIQNEESEALDGNHSQTLKENVAGNNIRLPKERRLRGPATFHDFKIPNEESIALDGSHGQWLTLTAEEAKKRFERDDESRLRWNNSASFSTPNSSNRCGGGHPGNEDESMGTYFMKRSTFPQTLTKDAVRLTKNIFKAKLPAAAAVNHDSETQNEEPNALEKSNSHPETVAENTDNTKLPEPKSTLRPQMNANKRYFEKMKVVRKKYLEDLSKKLNGLNENTCFICVKHFETDLEYSTHVQIHDNEKKDFLCGHCHKNFAPYQKFETHIIRVLNKVQVEIPIPVNTETSNSSQNEEEGVGGDDQDISSSGEFYPIHFLSLFVDEDDAGSNTNNNQVDIDVNLPLPLDLPTTRPLDNPLGPVTSPNLTFGSADGAFPESSTTVVKTESEASAGASITSYADALFQLTRIRNFALELKDSTLGFAIHDLEKLVMAKAMESKSK